ncbi:MAG: serine/threonine-protein kinase [Spirochaetaceae bacterium]
MAKIPAKIGKYKVVEQIASGGMGAVYKAEHPTLSRYVIIKKLTLRGDASMRERFRREAQIMMDFTSDYIVNVYDHFREGSSYYIVLEYVDGPSLETLLRRERYLPEHVALRVFRSCCRALQYAHQRGVVHRDIKPGNILISTEGQVKLVDFGVASIHGGESEQSLTREGMTLGTPSYMPPEQYADSRTVDKRADIYAMGVMLYEMTTGKKPFPNSISADVIRRIQQGKYTKPRKHNPKISGSTQRLIRRSMRVKPERRFQSMDALLEKVDKVTDRRVRMSDAEIVREFIAGKRVPLATTGRGKRARRVALTLLVLLLAGGAGYGYLAGYHYEYLYPDEYGALQVRVRLPKSAKNADEIYVGADIFRDEDEEIPPVENAHLRFRQVPEQETEDTVVFESRKLYLPAESYRLKVSAEQGLFWRSIRLAPRSVQRDSARTREAREVRVEVSPPPELPLSVGFEAADAVTGESLDDEATVEVRRDGRWRELSQEEREELTTGGVYRFRVRADAYFTEEYALRVEPYQSELGVRAELDPYPAAVRIEGTTPEMTLRVDEEERYVRGGRSPQLQDVPELDEEPVELRLLPGERRITIRRDGASASATLRLDPLDRRLLRVEHDPDEERLELRRVRDSVDPSLGEEEG